MAKKPVHIRQTGSVTLCGAKPTGKPYKDSDPGCQPCLTKATLLLNEALAIMRLVERRDQVDPTELKSGDRVEAVETFVVDKVQRKKGLVLAHNTLTYDFESYDFYRIGD